MHSNGSQRWKSHRYEFGHEHVPHWNRANVTATVGVVTLQVTGSESQFVVLRSICDTGLNVCMSATQIHSLDATRGCGFSVKNMTSKRICEMLTVTQLLLHTIHQLCYCM